MSELLAAAVDSPTLLAVLVIGGFAVYAIERLAGVDGPLTRAFRAWQERELRRLRRQRALDAERARPDQVAELEDEVRRLRAELARTRGRPEPEQQPATAPIPGRGRRNSPRHSPPPR